MDKRKLKNTHTHTETESLCHKQILQCLHRNYYEQMHEKIHMLNVCGLTLFWPQHFQSTCILFRAKKKFVFTFSLLTLAWSKSLLHVMLYNFFYLYVVIIILRHY